jgi:hypothetical protein
MQDLLVRICREVEDEYGGDVGSLVIGPREKECCLLKNEGKMRNVCHIERWFKVIGYLVVGIILQKQIYK